MMQHGGPLSSPLLANKISKPSVVVLGAGKLVTTDEPTSNSQHNPDDEAIQFSFGKDGASIVSPGQPEESPAQLRRRQYLQPSRTPLRKNGVEPQTLNEKLTARNAAAQDMVNEIQENNENGDDDDTMTDSLMSLVSLGMEEEEEEEMPEETGTTIIVETEEPSSPLWKQLASVDPQPNPRNDMGANSSTGSVSSRSSARRTIFPEVVAKEETAIVVEEKKEEPTTPRLDNTTPKEIDPTTVENNKREPYWKELAGVEPHHSSQEPSEEEEEEEEEETPTSKQEEDDVVPLSEDVTSMSTMSEDHESGSANMGANEAPVHLVVVDTSSDEEKEEVVGSQDILVMPDSVSSATIHDRATTTPTTAPEWKLDFWLANAVGTWLTVVWVAYIYNLVQEIQASSA